MFFKLLDYRYTGLLCLLLVIGYFSVEMFGASKQRFLPGQTTSAHHQVELACELCHSPLDGVKQEVCLDCHGDALKQVSDSHAVKVFNDPRSFAMLEKLDAKRCVTCHAEHLGEQYQDKAASVPVDFCFACHDDIGQERASHKGLSPEGCSASGCHNYHDNTALYEDFVKKHLDEQGTFISAVVPSRNIGTINRQKVKIAVKSLNSDDHDGRSLKQNPTLIGQWADSEHAAAGINCSHCHQANSKIAGMRNMEWDDRVSEKVCQHCHDKEAERFFQGKHGMRLAAGLSPMKPGLARIPMNPKAHDKELTCNSCHSAHDYEMQKAAVDSCLTCHDDTHSKAYLESPHYQLWKKALSGELPAGAGVSCATCHLPRLIVKQEGVTRVLVDHNQNANLRPNSKMIRDVCMHCHGLEFSLASLADSNLQLNNYSGQPIKSHKTVEMVRNRKKK